MKRNNAYFLLPIVFFFLLEVQALKAQEYPKRELRAAWIATVENIDWPDEKGLKAQDQKEQYVLLLDKLKAAGMNAIIMQIRPTADTFYPSSYEPWSAYLTGEQAQAPQAYYNPLTFLIDEAKKKRHGISCVV